MIKQILALALVALVVGVSAASAAVDKVEVTVGPSGKTIHIPARAVEVAPNVFSLGEAVDPTSGEVVQGYATVHRKESEARPETSSKPIKSACYGYLAEGAKWKTVEDWMVNPANAFGLTNDFIFNTLTNGLAKWEDAADGKVGTGPGREITGTGAVTANVLTADFNTLDGINEVYFGSIDDANIIAITVTWGLFSGPVADRYLVEWDMVFNPAYAWSATGDANAMDFNNIATHELGHVVGLSDLYTANCNTETMYGLASLGETLKQTLNAGDIAGISKLYRR